MISVNSSGVGLVANDATVRTLLVFGSAIFSRTRTGFRVGRLSVVA